MNPAFTNVSRSLALDPLNDPYGPVAVTDLRDRHLPAAVGPASGAWTATPTEEVLLTGATGFLGVFLLRELLRTDPAQHVVCLVRAPDAAAARSRVQRAADRFGVFLTRQMWERVTYEAGNLCDSTLGMAADRYQTHARCIGAVYHSAAAVNWVDPFSAVAPATIAGTRNVLSFAATERVKPVHHVSSLAVFPFDATPMRETDPLDHGGRLLGGYAQAKWVAERLVTDSGNQGLPVRIYRPSIVTGHSRTGVFNETSYFENVVRGCLTLGMLPDSGFVDVVPVDFVATALVRLSRQAFAEDGDVIARHLNNPRPLDMTGFAKWLRRRGHTMRTAPFDEWKRATAGELHRPTSPLYPFRRHLERTTAAHFSIPSHHCQQTTARLVAEGIGCPGVRDDLLPVYFERFDDAGFLEEL